MEMLIVVAIIAILVAIAIPTFSGALEKAREAADVANLRAAYAQAMVDNMVNEEDFGEYSDYNDVALVSKAGEGNEASIWTVDDGVLTIAFDGTYVDLSLTGEPMALDSTTSGGNTGNTTT